MTDRWTDRWIDISIYRADIKAINETGLCSVAQATRNKIPPDISHMQI